MKLYIVFIYMCVCLRVYGCPDTIYFNKKSSLPSIAVSDFAYFVIDSNFYIACGADSLGALSNEVWKYNSNTDTWHQMRNFPGGRKHYLSGFAINQKGYICCGTDSMDNWTNDFWEYYPAVDSWQHKANYPDSPRVNFTTFVNGNNAYVGLGQALADANHLWRYNQALDSWSQMSSFPQNGRYCTTTAISDSFAYVIGGQNRQQANFFYRDIWRYCFLANRWDSIGLMPPQNLTREGAVFWSFDSILIGGGGLTLDSLGIYQLKGDFYSYRIKLNEWRSVVCLDFLDSVAIAATFTFGKTGYLFGGDTRDNPYYSYSNAMWSFDATPILKKQEAGISDIASEAGLKIYPNPLTSGQSIKVETAEAGEISFHDILGQELLHSSLHTGVNEMRFGSESGIVFYTVVYHDGRTALGRLLVW